VVGCAAGSAAPVVETALQDTVHGREADDDDDVVVVQELTQQDRTAAARASLIDVDDARA
jgi:hypothetical protein